MSTGPDLRERTFGKLTVARADSEVWQIPVSWVCFCECKAQIVVLEAKLIHGEVISCEKC